jgi:O-antigen/teichoic acid export membrane protein
MQTIDRYWLEALGGIEIVGTYVLFLGMASALMVFLDASIFSFSYPSLIRQNNAGNFSHFREEVRRIFIYTIIASLAFCISSWIILPYLLHWVGNPLYEQSLWLYPWVLAASVINAVGMVPHYALYARGCDRPIIYSHLAALPAFAFSTWAISRIEPLLAVPAGVVAAFTLILVWKTGAYLKIAPGPGRAL